MLENGKINMSATELPAFLWEDNRAKYNDEDIYLGLFYGFYLEGVSVLTPAQTFRLMPESSVK